MTSTPNQKSMSHILKAILGVVLLFVCFGLVGAQGHLTKKYKKKDGTVVPPHWSTRPTSVKKKRPSKVQSLPGVTYPSFYKRPTSDTNVHVQPTHPFSSTYQVGQVFVAGTSHVFHKPGCYALKRAKTTREIPMAEAQRKGYKPCKICFGPGR